MKTKLYLLPGTMCNYRLWSKIAPLIDEYQLIYIELPICESYEELLSYIHSKYGEEKINLIGFSLGGYIATLYALKYPQSVNKSLIISNSSTSLPPKETTKRKQAIEFTKKYGFKSLSKPMVSSMFDNTTQEDFDIVIKMYEEMGKEQFFSQMGYTSIRDDLYDQLKQIDSHMMFVYGKNDRLVDANWITKLKKENKRIKEVVLNTSSHMLPLEANENIAKIISMFFKG